jgi:hypothetical protein
MRSLRVAVLALALLAVSSVAWAQEFSEGFESYTPGTMLQGAGGWKGWDNSAAASSPVSNKYAFTGKNSVAISGPSDQVHQFTCAGGTWIFSAMQYIPSDVTGEPYFIMLNTYQDSGSDDWSIQLHYIPSSGTITAEAEGGSAQTQIIFDRWVELKFVIDLTNNWCDWYYAGRLIKSHRWDDNAHGTFQAVDLYANNSSPVYYDDVKLTRVPYEDPYKAQSPTPADGAVGVAGPLMKWVRGYDAQYHDVYFGTTPDLTAADLKMPHINYEMYYHFLGITPGVTYYWRIDEYRSDGTVAKGDVWSFTAAPNTAWSPYPGNGAMWVDPNADLSWQSGVTATSHQVYFGTDQAAVTARDAATLKATQSGTTLELPKLAQNTTYYWAVDEVGAMTYPGDVWSFATGGPVGGVRAQYFGGKLAGGPIVSRIEPAIDHQWGEGEVAGGLVDNVSARWTADLVVTWADAFTFITTSDDGARLFLNDKPIVIAWWDQGTTDHSSQPIKLQPGVYRLRMEWYENGGGAVAQLSWQTGAMPRGIIPAGPLQPPLWSYAFYPANGETAVPMDVTLIWTAGEKATTHSVYLGEDKAAVAAATPDDATIFRESLDKENVNFAPGALEPGKTYYWRVDEINDAEAQSPWKGTVWSFTTADVVVVDNFEGYTNDSPNRVFQTWIDGMGFSEDEFFPDGNPGNGSSAAVGHDVWSPGTTYSTIMETYITHDGRQSMPVDYNNANSPYYSEVTRTWKTAQDWMAKGGNTLVLYIRGDIANKPAKLFVTLQDSAGKSFTVSSTDDTAVTSQFWVEWKIPLSDFSGVDVAKIKQMAIGVGNRAAPTAGSGGTIYIDDIKVIKP